MATSYVFHHDVLIAEHVTFPNKKFLLPEGAYLLTNTQWYLKMRVSLVPLNLCDVPSTLKTYCLLMGIQYG